MTKMMSDFELQVIKPLLASLSRKQRDAFNINGGYYTYGQLADRVSAIRTALRAGNLEEQVLALAVHDDLDTYASILALWMEGKAYVPLHPNQPLDRNLDIIAQVGMSTLLDSSEQSVFEDKGLDIIETCQCANTDDNLDQWKEVGDEALAYILFTSGSTGAPKGVQITRGNLAAFMDSFWKTGISLTEEDRCMQVFDLTFDVSVQSFLVALTRGACVFTVPYGQVKYLYAASLIQEQHVTFGAMAPSMLTYLRPYFDEFDASSMRTCILTAEACPVDLLEDWFRCAKNTEIYDFYGPTEATVYCTCYKVKRDERNLSYNGVVSIGKPLANVRAIIILEDGTLVHGQEKGELCVAGKQVTPGYWNNNERNVNAFFDIDGIRYYHTGDLCYWDKSGNIMYSGRMDQQAKIQGYRVELGEIEHHARQYYGNEHRVAAVAFQNDNKLTEIALFIESEQESDQLLLDYLRSKMPPYMIPTRVLFAPQLPQNKSEKIDRNALKQRL